MGLMGLDYEVNGADCRMSIALKAKHPTKQLLNEKFVNPHDPPRLKYVKRCHQIHFLVLKILSVDYDLKLNFVHKTFLEIFLNEVEQGHITSYDDAITFLHQIIDGDFNEALKRFQR